MYSDIIPPRKNSSIRNITMERFDKLEPLSDKIYLPDTNHSTHTRSFPKFILFLVIGLLLVGGIIYAKFIEHTKIVFTTKTTTIDVREKVSMAVQQDDSKAVEGTLFYNLVYISGKQKDRNPFTKVSSQQSSSSTVSNKLKDMEFTPVTAVSTSTNSTTTVYLVNTTKENIPLRATTRIDIGGTIYSLPKSTTAVVTKDASVFAKKEKYFLPGFKGSTQYESIYAVSTTGVLSVDTHQNTESPANTVSTTTEGVGEPVAALVPEDIISLLPDTSVALKKNTIYDNMADQPAVVVFDKKELLNVVQKKNPALQEYLKAFKPIEDLVVFEVVIVDYELDISSESGRPIGMKRMVLEIRPVFNMEESKKAFNNFSTDAMEKIKVQLGSYASLDVHNTPFWSREVAGEGKVEVIIEE